MGSGRVEFHMVFVQDGDSIAVRPYLLFYHEVIAVRLDSTFPILCRRCRKFLSKNPHDFLSVVTGSSVCHL